MMLHLEGLNCICHSFCQISSLLRSSWRLSQSESSTTTPYKRVSSANSLTVEVRPFARSLMYVRNNSRRSTDPCGTPEVTGEEVDVAPSDDSLDPLSEKGFHPGREVSMDTVTLKLH